MKIHQYQIYITTTLRKVLFTGNKSYSAERCHEHKNGQIKDFTKRNNILISQTVNLHETLHSATAPFRETVQLVRKVGEVRAAAQPPLSPPAPHNKNLSF